MSLFKAVKFLLLGDERKYISFRFRLSEFKYNRDYLRFKRSLKYPICLVLGHDYYESHGWLGGAGKCTRCNYHHTIWKSKSYK